MVECSAFVIAVSVSPYLHIVIQIYRDSFLACVCNVQVCVLISERIGSLPSIVCEVIHVYIRT